MNDYRLNRQHTKQLTDKEAKSIENRQKLALMYRAKEKIEDYQNEVFEIIDKDGLQNDEDRRRLETALKVLPYITPQKKAIETTVITKSIEDIIKESTEEAEFEEIDENNRDSKESANNE